MLMNSKAPSIPVPTESAEQQCLGRESWRAGTEKAVLFGVDWASGKDSGTVVRHYEAGRDLPLSLEVMTKEEHEAAHAAERQG